MLLLSSTAAYKCVSQGAVQLRLLTRRIRLLLYLPSPADVLLLAVVPPALDALVSTPGLLLFNEQFASIGTPPAALLALSGPPSAALWVLAGVTSSACSRCC